MARRPSATDPRPLGRRSDLPELRPGDRLDRSTYHERYLAMPEDFRAELIGGVVMAPPPVSAHHGDRHGQVAAWLGVYASSTPGTRLLVKPTLLLGPESEPEPDAVLILEPARGGRTRREGPFLAGPPELVVEVADCGAAYDRRARYADNEAAGVLEYAVVALHEATVEWHVLRDDHFTPLAPTDDGTFRSATFPGLRLDPAALLRGDMAGVLAALRLGLESPEHAAFVARLAGREPGR